MLTISVKDFGPIVEGEIGLKPLTVFVGPNNTGKSYLAMLAYAIYHSTQGLFYPAGSRRFRVGSFAGRFLYSPAFIITPTVEETLKSDTSIDTIKQWLGQVITVEARRQSLSIGSLPLLLQEAFREIVGSYFQDYSVSMAREIKRCFGAELTDLRRSGSSGTGFQISIERTEPNLSATFRARNGSLTSQGVEFDFAHLDFAPLPRLPSSPTRVMRLRNEEVVDIAESLLLQAFDSFYRSTWLNAHYMPAARSGIQQAHKALTSFLVSRSAFVGLEPIEVPQLSGVVVDFLLNLIRLEKRRTSKLERITSFLEEEVLKGKVTVETGKLEYPEMYYESQAGRFPIFRTSSMISELAPIIVLLKHVADPSDLLIIEEPESHLHPENQRKLARTLVKLIRQNVKVLITTHSDYFLEQLTNFLRLGSISADERVPIGYDQDDFLGGDEVALYLFRHDAERGGSTVTHLELNLEDGIADPEFQRVTESLYKETVSLQRRLLED